MKVRLALSWEVLHVIELQPSDTLDTLPLAVSTIIPAERTTYHLFTLMHGNQVLKGPQTIVEAGLVSGSENSVAMHKNLPNFVTAERLTPHMCVVKTWRCHEWTPEVTLEMSDGIHSVEASLDGQLAVVISSELRGVPKVFDVETHEHLTTFTEHTGGIDYVCISSCNCLVVTISHASSAKIWQVATGHCISTLTWDMVSRCCAAILPSCHRVASSLLT